MAEFLPHSQAAWNAETKARGVDPSAGIASEKSGSGITVRDFLTFRALWPQCASTTKELEKDSERLLQRNYSAAAAFLDSSTEFQKYLKSIDPRKSEVTRASVDIPGTFALVRYYQYLSTQQKQRRLDGDDPAWNLLTPKVAMFTRSRAKQEQTLRQQPSTPTRASGANEPLQGLYEGLDDLNISPSSFQSSETSDFPDPQRSMSPFTPLVSMYPGEAEAIEDEQIVNTALILFLNALTILCPMVSNSWTMYRRPFTYRDRNGVKVYEARVDGLLRSDKRQLQNNEVRMIVEVKPCYRCMKADEAKPVPKAKIRMQETAQMVAWVYECHKSHKVSASSKHSSYQRILISQDQQEIFITVATYDDNYVRYVQGDVRQEAFINMKDYGPFRVTDVAHMNHVGKLILGFTLAEEGDHAYERTALR